VEERERIRIEARAPPTEVGVVRLVRVRRDVRVGQQRQQDGREVAFDDLDLDAAVGHLVAQQLHEADALGLTGSHVDLRAEGLVTAGGRTGGIAIGVGLDRPTGLLEEADRLLDVALDGLQIRVEGP
jgi:hypothetical protein